MSIGITISRTVTNVETNSDIALRYFAITLDVAMTMNFRRAFSYPDVENSIDGMRSTAFRSVESEIISLAAIITISDTKIACIENSQVAFFILFNKRAVLYTKITMPISLAMCFFIILNNVAVCGLYLIL